MYIHTHREMDGKKSRWAGLQIKERQFQLEVLTKATAKGLSVYRILLQQFPLQQKNKNVFLN